MTNHPTGIAGVLASLLVIVAGQLGLDLSAEQAVAIVGAITAVVSAFSPRVVDVYTIEFAPEAKQENGGK
jgi:hypothetical protein